MLLPLVRPPGAPAVPRRTGDSTSTPGLWAAYRQVVYRLLLASTQLYTATGVVNSGRPSGPVGPPTPNVCSNWPAWCASDFLAGFRG